jgi:DNA-binding NarL/FixJ family response regulator
MSHRTGRIRVLASLRSRQHLGEVTVCTAVRIVVAAAGRERRLELRRSVVTAEWEVVGEADGPQAAYQEAVERRARFLVLDESAAGPRPESIVRRLKSVSPNAFVIAVGDLATAGADAAVPADGLDALRDTMRDLLHASGDHAHA